MNFSLLILGAGSVMNHPRTARILRGHIRSRQRGFDPAVRQESVLNRIVFFLQVCHVKFVKIGLAGCHHVHGWSSGLFLYLIKLCLLWISGICGVNEDALCYCLHGGTVKLVQIQHCRATVMFPGTGE